MIDGLPVHRRRWQVPGLFRNPMAAGSGRVPGRLFHPYPLVSLPFGRIGSCWRRDGVGIDVQQTPGPAALGDRERVALDAVPIRTEARPLRTAHRDTEPDAARCCPCCPLWPSTCLAATVLAQSGLDCWPWSAASPGCSLWAGCSWRNRADQILQQPWGTPLRGRSPLRFVSTTTKSMVRLVQLREVGVLDPLRL